MEYVIVIGPVKILNRQDVHDGYDQTLSFKAIKKSIFTPSLWHQHHIINFNFSFEFEFSQWVQDRHDSTWLYFVGLEQDNVPFIDVNQSVKVHQHQQDKRLVCNYEIPIALERILTSVPLSWLTRRLLAEVAQNEAEEAMRAKPSLGYAVSELDFKVNVENEHVVDMVPVVDLSIQSSETYEIDSGHMTDFSCCICLEDFSGRDALSMPCEHVFHDDCIKEWLKTSHYCPVCASRCQRQWRTGASGAL